MAFKVLLVLLISMASFVIAAPQVTISKWPPHPSIPTVCFPFSTTASPPKPTCPSGYTCYTYSSQPTTLPSDGISGYCTSSIYTPPPIEPSPSHTCTRDYRGICWPWRPSASSTVLTTTTDNVTTPRLRVVKGSAPPCSSGYTLDYRYICRPTSTPWATVTTSATSDTKACLDGSAWVTDSNGVGYCHATATSALAAGYESRG
ncbi:hypothetical protein BS50DRAFT_582853 [Corynespora cassiicola Philippines]|uniref:CBM1 domain-containing protein n=1 Tax=Corynespora cassiicola Philippines TaxID=1448308 RepID=A0A2T2P6U9_CORCC|nr:hypothetical protein BS50DRAFT_582853 [Corynespora cassiicola Philippines]